MGALSNDQSMEEILSSIKRIIADEDNARSSGTPRVPRRRSAPRAAAPMDPSDDDQILELTEIASAGPAPEAALAESEIAPIEAAADDDDVLDTSELVLVEEAEESEIMAKQATATTSRASARVTADMENSEPVISTSSAAAVRESLSSLSSLLVKPADAPSNTLEGMVQDMLRPMLKEWLDANLPTMVETMVKREIEKITGRV